jgi:hypothetical protein
LKNSKSHGVLVAPKWQSAVFWPLVSDGKNWRSGIILLTEYYKPKDFFIKCPHGNDMFTEKPFGGSVVVLSIDYRV